MPAGTKPSSRRTAPRTATSRSSTRRSRSVWSVSSESVIDVSRIDPAVGEFDGDLGLLTRLAVVQLGFELGTAALLAWAWSRRAGIAYLILGTPFLLFPFPYVRIDLFSVFLAVLALSLVRKGMDRTGGVALGVAALAKLWPLVLAPLLIVTDRRRSLVSWAITMAVGVALWLAFFGPAGLAQVATFRGSKGWQIESIPGVFFHMADHGASHVEQGAWRTGAQVPLVVKPLLPLLALGNALLAWWWARARHLRNVGGR